ncbi:sugar-transfer associated ATP-grasp domain-containing protein [Exiguobacterium sp. s22]|uniref:ATP-grasp domain-containing protein n=1 Tax=Exiguobacterium sp. s22 TaxID=2751272 RepID=UPI002036D2FB|nr:sugar-transfer associated ATP-grasp domain-containing protein [Exiguobacterium sp. s22]
MLKLMLLGGAMHQVPVIQKAKEQGIFTILCDYLPDNPGRQVADRYYCISSLDRESVLDIARQEQIDGILAYASDPAARTAAYVGEALGLKSNPLQAVETLTNKARFRTFLRDHGFAVPKAYAFTDFESAMRTMQFVEGEFVIKPADASGSKGISKWCSNDGVDRLREQVSAALEVSFGDEVVVEEFIRRDGYQVAGDGFIVKGQLVFRCFGNSHFNERGVNPFAPISASFPSQHPPHVLDRVHETLQRMITEVGLQNGPLNFDIFVKGEDVYLMDIGPRNGGNYIPQIIEQATGVDLVKATIDVALGQPVSIDMKLVTVPSAYFILGSQQEGRFMGISFMNDDYAIMHSNLCYAIGAQVPRFDGANRALGSLILRFKDVEAMMRLLNEPEQWMTLHITSNDVKEEESWKSSSPVRTAF